MKPSDLHLVPALQKIINQYPIFRPSQEKAINAGLLEHKNLLICTPTASGKTLIGEIACLQSILQRRGKAIYIVPLKALAQEKSKDFKLRYGDLCKISLSIGDMDKDEGYLGTNDLIITVSEKLDSLMRHQVSWLSEIATVIVDEIHVLNDTTRGPTLEVVITLLKQIVPQAQFIGLSATIGNPKELAEWLGANLVIDDWRPVELKKGIHFEDKIEFYK